MDRPLRGVSFDALGTLLHPREPIARTYAHVAREFGIGAREEEISRGLRAALSTPAERGAPTLDGRALWRPIVARVTGSTDEAYFEALYRIFGEARTWQL